MSTWKSGNISEGDVVILYGGKERINSVKLLKGKVFSSRFGNFPHADIIGKTFGTKIFDKDGGWIVALSPTPELYTAGALAHRTQIIYTTDISAITLYLELKPGSIVVESGTGSGSLSRAFARTIAPNGHLYTFEYHEQRSKLARESFIESGLGKLITVTNRDVCELGFALDAGTADAVMLDLPSPWLAIPHAAKVLKHYGMLCNFSPCIEQVQKACESMRANGFSDIVTVECLLRPFEVKPFQFDLIVPPVLPARKRARTAEEENNNSHTTSATQPYEKVQATSTSPSVPSTVVSVLAIAEHNNNNGDNNAEEDEDADNNKAEETEQQEEEGGGQAPADEMQEALIVATSSSSMPAPIIPSVSALIPTPSVVPPHTITAATVVPLVARKPAAAAGAAARAAVPSARPEASIRGHTSFLTFARRIVL